MKLWSLRRASQELSKVNPECSAIVDSWIARLENPGRTDHHGKWLIEHERKLSASAILHSDNGSDVSTFIATDGVLPSQKP